MTMKPSALLLKMLKPPAKMADALDWKKQSSTVATLHIGRDRIGMAIASHPDFGEEVHTVKPLPLRLVTTREGNQRVLAPSCLEQLQILCDANRVGSFLVWWPLQSEGRPGARCGKVLHTLEALIAQSDTILTPHRPVCLWTGDMEKDLREKYAEDEWGRSSVYSRSVYDKTIHRASQEQYCHPRGSSASAAETWGEFCKQYWPHSVYCQEALNKVRPGDTTIHQDSSPMSLHGDGATVSFSMPLLSTQLT